MLSVGILRIETDNRGLENVIPIGLKDESLTISRCMLDRPGKTSHWDSQSGGVRTVTPMWKSWLIRRPQQRHGEEDCLRSCSSAVD